MREGREGQGGTHIRLGPDAGLGHGADEVRAREEHHLHGLAHLLAVAVVAAVIRWDEHAAEDGVDLVVEVVEDDGGALVLGLAGLPGVDHEPGGGLLCGEGAHVDAAKADGERARIGVAITGGKRRETEIRYRKTASDRRP